MATTIIDSPMSRSPHSKSARSFIRLTSLSFKRPRLTYSVLAVVSFVAVSWRGHYYSHDEGGGEFDYDSLLFFQSSPSSFKQTSNNGYEYSGVVPTVPLSTTQRSLFDDENNNNNNLPNTADSTVNTKDPARVNNNTKYFLDDEQMIYPQQQQNLTVYVQRHCDLRITTVHDDNATTDAENHDVNNNMEEEWWPANASDWRRRTPAALIIGAKKAGTTSLWLSLLRHSNSAASRATTTTGSSSIHYPKVERGRVKELLYFIPYRFQGGWKNETSRDIVLVHEARRNMYETNQDYPVEVLRRNPDAVSLEATPDYLLHSTYSARAILCTIPWVKLIVLLRHPIDRLWSHYNFLIDPNIIGLKHLLPFDEWVDQDIRRLQSYGILPQNLSNIEAHSGSVQEKRGWRVYQQEKSKHSGGDRPVARSLYAIQLEEWFLHLRQVGKDPADCVKIVLSSDLQQHQESVAKDILQWIAKPSVRQQPRQQGNNLDNPQQQASLRRQQQRRRVQSPGHPRTYHPTTQEQQQQQQQQKRVTKGMVTTYTSPPMKEETRQKLELLFAPYNRRLYRLLGPEWDGIFDAAA